MYQLYSKIKVTGGACGRDCFLFTKVPFSYWHSSHTVFPPFPCSSGWPNPWVLLNITEQKFLLLLVWSLTAPHVLFCAISSVRWERTTVKGVGQEATTGRRAPWLLNVCARDELPTALPLYHVVSKKLIFTVFIYWHFGVCCYSLPSLNWYSCLICAPSLLGLTGLKRKYLYFVTAPRYSNVCGLWQYYTSFYNWLYPLPSYILPVEYLGKAFTILIFSSMF